MTKNLKEQLATKNQIISQLEIQIAEKLKNTKPSYTGQVNVNFQILQEKSKKEINNITITNAKPDLKIPGLIWAIASDSKGNIYLGSRNASWKGHVYKCLAGETIFKPMSGFDGEVWTILIDKDDNVYAGTREGRNEGSIYKCLVNQNTFNKIEGVNKCVSSLILDNNNNIYAGIWTGQNKWYANNGNIYKCLAGETIFKPMSGIKGGVLALSFNKKLTFYTLLHEMEKEVLTIKMVHFINIQHYQIILLYLLNKNYLPYDI